MKNLAYFRLLSSLVNLVFWALAIFIIAWTVREVYLFSKGEHHPFSIDNAEFVFDSRRKAITAYESLDLKEAGRTVRFSPVSRTSVAFFYDNSAAFRRDFPICLSVHLPIQLTFLLSLAAIRLLKKLIDSVIQDKVFTSDNVRRIRLLGFLILVGQLTPQLAWWVHEGLIKSILAQHGYLFQQPHRTFHVNDWLTGFIVIGLAEVFRQGLKLKQEQDLTI